MTDTTASHLTEEQLARAEALEAARRVLVARTPLASTAVTEPVSLHALAVFILDGGDPWELPEAKVAPATDDGPLARRGLAHIITERLVAGNLIEWRARAEDAILRVLTEQGIEALAVPSDEGDR